MEPFVLIVGVFVVATAMIWRGRARTNRAIVGRGLDGLAQGARDLPVTDAGHGSLRNHGRPRERGN